MGRNSTTSVWPNSKEEVEILNKAVLDASRARLTFDDDPAAFASLLAKEAK